MILAIPLAWLQLKREKLRLLAALAGVGFSVVLIFMQLGFQGALLESSVRYHGKLVFDLAMISPRTDFIVQPTGFARRRLIQALALPEVESVSSVYLGQAKWKNPERPSETRAIFVVGFDPDERVFDLPGVRHGTEAIRLPDRVLYDAFSRPEFGPVVDLVRRDGRVRTEVGARAIEVVGLFEIGTSFGIDGSIVTSDLNFRRIFPHRRAGEIELGLIHLVPGAEPERVRERLDAMLDEDVLILTRQGFVDREIDYWNRMTPIGYVFSFGVVIGMVVGSIIVYQILFAEVCDHLREYATLKAMGYPDRYLFGVVMRQAVMLAAFGFVPGLGISLLMYGVTRDATQLPLEMTPFLAGGVFALIVGMCCFSGAIALRKLRSADPAEIF